MLLILLTQVLVDVDVVDLVNAGVVDVDLVDLVEDQEAAGTPFLYLYSGLPLHSPLPIGWWVDFSL